MSKTYVVTGATGYLGFYLSRKLLREGHNLIFLGRSKNGVSLSVRLAHVANASAQASFIETDLANMDVSKIAHQIGAISSHVDGVWHLAADLSFKPKDRERVFGTNLGALASVISLTKKLSCPLFYTSTAYVHGLTPGVAYEKLGTKPLRFNNAYEESKYDAEAVVMADKELDALIFRPSILIDSSVEHMSNFGYYSFLVGLNKFKSSLKQPIDSKFVLPVPFLYVKGSTLNLMPVDIAVNWMYQISQSGEAVGKIFHIANPSPFLIGNIFAQTFRIFNIKIPLMSAPKALVSAYLSTGRSVGFIVRPLKPVMRRLQYFRGYLLNDVRYDLTNVRSIVGTNLEDSFVFPPDYIFDMGRRFVQKLNHTSSE
jgi:nucleoside-diphosphate-sugar epimerase